MRKYDWNVDLTVVYETNNYTYTYTISNISADHTISVANSSSSYIKLNEAYVPISKLYKKVSGSWVQQNEYNQSLFTNVYFHQQN